MKNDFDINESECTRCKLCVETYPDSFIVDDAGSILVVSGLCDQLEANICPVGAIVNYSKNQG